MPEPTPKPWSEATAPTPEQAVDWFEVATREERLDAMTRLLRANGIAGTCILEHGFLVEELAALQLRNDAETPSHD